MSPKLLLFLSQILNLYSISKLIIMQIVMIHLPIFFLSANFYAYLTSPHLPKSLIHIPTFYLFISQPNSLSYISQKLVFFSIFSQLGLLILSFVRGLFVKIISQVNFLPSVLFIAWARMEGSGYFLFFLLLPSSPSPEFFNFPIVR